MRYFIIFVVYLFQVSAVAQPGQASYSISKDSLGVHRVLLDDQSKIISWMQPQSSAYDQFLRKRWNFIKTSVPNSPGPEPRSSYPQYYFYCAYKNPQLEPDTWMNDIGERIPNWFESARLYYAYTGDGSVMNIVERLMDYVIDHGTTTSNFSWPNFPYTAANAGDTLFTGFTRNGKVPAHEVQVDHAGDMGFAYWRLFQFTGKYKYKHAAIQIANTLMSKIRNGSASQSPWPYRVNMKTGHVIAEYGANWFGCYALLDELARAAIGNSAAYREAMSKVSSFILQFPMKSGYWTDGHTDTEVNSHTYKSNMSASNAALYILDHPGFDPDWKAHIPKLISWTEKNFVFRSAPGEASTMWGANIVGEQDTFLYKMDYQTARYAAECARWYAFSGDTSFKEKAFRSLNWVTYCSDSNGLAFESPISKGITSWWSDCYGEGPRMFYHALAAVPEWAPERENHILYSGSILKDVSYQPMQVTYTPADNSGVEYLSLQFLPKKITLAGKEMAVRKDLREQGYTIRKLNNNQYAIQIKRKKPGKMVISGI